jgi:hypothetical protein
LHIPASGGSAALKRPREIGKELVGELLGGTVDQALAKLRQLSADLAST